MCRENSVEQDHPFKGDVGQVESNETVIELNVC